MSTASLVDAIAKRFLTTSFPKHTGNTNYAEIKWSHQLLTENVALVGRKLERVQNGYLGLVLPPKQYT